MKSSTRRSISSSVFVLMPLPGVLLSTPAALARADAAQTKAEIQATFDKAAKLVSRKDIDGLAEMIDPGATFSSPDGKTMTYEQWKAATKKAFAGMTTMRTTIKVGSVSEKGNTVTATMTETDDYAMTKDKGHKFHEVSKGTIHLNKTDKGWIASKFVVVSDKITRDGKPFTPPKDM